VDAEQGAIGDLASQRQALLASAHGALKFVGAVLPIKSTLGPVSPPLRDNIGHGLGQADQRCHDRPRKSNRPRRPMHMR
jgi:hypothetical protein